MGERKKMKFEDREQTRECGLMVDGGPWMVEDGCEENTSRKGPIWSGSKRELGRGPLFGEESGHLTWLNLKARMER